MVPLTIVYAALAVLSSASGVVADDRRPDAFNWDAIRYMYAFGDSYTFVQGTAGFANFRYVPSMHHAAREY
jgi:hypothetical protein